MYVHSYNNIYKTNDGITEISDINYYSFVTISKKRKYRDFKQTRRLKSVSKKETMERGPLHGFPKAAVDPLPKAPLALSPGAEHHGHGGEVAAREAEEDGARPVHAVPVEEDGPEALHTRRLKLEHDMDEFCSAVNQFFGSLLQKMKLIRLHDMILTW